jgi:hypothetical protein
LPENPTTDGSHVPDYRVYKDEMETQQPGNVSLTETAKNDLKIDDDIEGGPAVSSNVQQVELSALEKMEIEKRTIIGNWWLPRNLWIIFRYKIILVLTHGTNSELK